MTERQKTADSFFHDVPYYMGIAHIKDSEHQDEINECLEKYDKRAQDALAGALGEGVIENAGYRAEDAPLFLKGSIIRIECVAKRPLTPDEMKKAGDALQELHPSVAKDFNWGAARDLNKKGYGIVDMPSAFDRAKAPRLRVDNIKGKVQVYVQKGTERDHFKQMLVCPEDDGSYHYTYTFSKDSLPMMEAYSVDERIEETKKALSEFGADDISICTYEHKNEVTVSFVTPGDRPADIYAAAEKLDLMQRELQEKPELNESLVRQGEKDSSCGLEM